MPDVWHSSRLERSRYPHLLSSSWLTALEWTRILRELVTMPLVLGIANQKGGVGKTTTAKILGTLLAQTGKRVLLVDFDAQANLTEDLKFDPEALGEAGRTVYKSILRQAAVADLVLGGNPALVPSSIELASVEPELIANAFIA